MKNYIIHKIFSTRDVDGYWYIQHTDVIAVYSNLDDAKAKVVKSLEKTREMMGGIITTLWTAEDEKICYAEKLESNGDRYQLNIVQMEVK